MTDTPAVLDPLLRKSQILADPGVNYTTLARWVAQGHFPKPLVLNAGVGGREIIAWPTSVYIAWKAALPSRSAKALNKRGGRAKIGRPV